MTDNNKNKGFGSMPKKQVKEIAKKGGESSSKSTDNKSKDNKDKK